MRLTRRFAPRVPLPEHLEPTWWAFLDYLDVLEGGRPTAP